MLRLEIGYKMTGKQIPHYNIFEKRGSPCEILFRISCDKNKSVSLISRREGCMCQNHPRIRRDERHVILSIPMNVLESGDIV